MLAELRDYLQRHQRATLRDLAWHFRANPDALRGMLDKWIAKGRVRKLPAVSSCGGGCSGCSAGAQETYEWLGETSRT